VMLGVSDLSNMGCLLSFRIPTAPIDAFRAKRGGRVKAAERRAERAKP